MQLKSLSKTLLLALSLLMLSAVAVQAAEMRFIDRETVKKAITAGDSEYLLLDVRKTADYEKGHIAGALAADLDPAMGVTGSNAKGIATLKKALAENAGSENGTGKKLVILCYSGKGYAQKATDLLAEIGADAASVCTLEGGYKAWTGNDAGGEYAKLMVSGREPGSARR